MNGQPATMDEQIERLGRSSRRAASVSLMGFLLVIAAIGYAVIQLHILEEQKEAMIEEKRELQSRIESDRGELNSLKTQLAKSREALASARSAINAFHAGRLDEAVLLYDEALQTDPGNAYLQNLRAYALFRLGHIDAALDGERRSIVAEPKYAWGYLDLARFLCAASPSRMDEAKRSANEAIRLRPSLFDVMRGDGEFQRVCRHQIP